MRSRALDLVEKCRVILRDLVMKYLFVTGETTCKKHGKSVCHN